MSQVSEKRLAANRANARRSTGPITPEGKAASRSNALTHGLTAKIVAAPGEDQSEIDARREAWVDEIAGGSEVAAQFADLAFRALTRRRRIDQAADALMLARARRSEALWEEHRARQVKTAIEELEFAPSVAVARLRSTAEGARWLASAWRALAYTLDEGAWGTGEYNRSCSLLGVEEVGRVDLFEDTTTLLRMRDLCSKTGRGHTYTDASEDFFRIYDKIYEYDVCMEDLAEYRAAHRRTKELLQARVREYDALAAELEPLSRADRLDAAALVAMDDSEEGRLLLRYQAAADRDLHRN